MRIGFPVDTPGAVTCFGVGNRMVTGRYDLGFRSIISGWTDLIGSEC